MMAYNVSSISEVAEVNLGEVPRHGARYALLDEASGKLNIQYAQFL